MKSVAKWPLLRKEEFAFRTLLGKSDLSFEVNVPTGYLVPKVLVTGGGNGELVVALELFKFSFDFVVSERNLTEIPGDGIYLVRIVWTSII